MSNWQAAASVDSTKVKSWFTSSKPVNLAIATGRKGRDGRYLIALDGDVVAHPFIESLKSYGETVMQRSGSGGSHALYWSKVPVKNSCQLLDEKLDVRGLGGILIIAPSTHKSGQKYEFLCDLQTAEIQSCPVFLEEKLQATSQATKRVSKKAASARVGKADRQALAQEWQSRSVPEIREWLLDETNMVPNGIRNVTMHRLLSSDRAKGATKYQLESSALNYLSNFQEADLFLDEVVGIIDSVLRYQPYNNSHERVNEIYTKWLKKRGIEGECPLESLNQIDQEFFDSIDPKGGETVLLSLKEIGDRRALFFLSKGFAKFSVYKSQLLAKKLMECGAVRRRSAKNNLWEVSKRILGVEDGPPPSYPNLEEKLMGEEAKKDSKVKDGDIIEQNGRKYRVEVAPRTVPVETHSKEHLFQGRSGLEYNMANIRRISTLTDEQVDADAEGTLVLDPAASAAFVDSLLPGDIVGFKFDTYRVVSKENGLLLMPVQKVRVKDKVGQFEDIGTEVVPTEHEIDKFLSMGFFQILWRDGKPYGEESTKNINLIFFHPVNEQERK